MYPPEYMAGPCVTVRLSVLVRLNVPVRLSVPVHLNVPVRLSVPVHLNVPVRLSVPVPEGSPPYVLEHPPRWKILEVHCILTNFNIRKQVSNSRICVNLTL